VTAPGRQAGPEASDLGRFEPSAYDLGITDDPEILAAFSDADEAYGRAPGTAARLLAGEEITDPEAAFEAAAEVLDEWDPDAAAAYMDRVEAGLEPEAEL
jgi:hypothetical protein